MSTTSSPLERRVLEAFQELYDNFVDPHDDLYDDGQWTSLGGGATHVRTGLSSEQQLEQAREQCRLLAMTNEYAINGHENRISYLVGSGHTYRIVAKKGHEAAKSLLQSAQSVLDEFIKLNHWQRRQQEIVRRYDRDGEVFLRQFTGADGITRIRFIEPAQVAAPATRSGDPAVTFGILTDPDDVETVQGYFVDGQFVGAAEIQHRKANVDCNVKRGVPLFFPVRKNLRRAEKLLRNMSVVAEIQSAIALIRRHGNATRSGVQQFVSGQTDASVTSPITGRTTSYRRFSPGTILDAPGGIEYDFPASGLDASTYVTILQAELRAIASRLVMPEFMLTSDASNSNYASTMVAEGPALRMFERLQAELMEDDLEILWQVLRSAAKAGHLSSPELEDIDIQINPPSLAVRDPQKEASVYRLEHSAGILSPQTWSGLRGYDYDQEQSNLREHKKTAAPTDDASEKIEGGQKLL
jgi:capsid protein